MPKKRKRKRPNKTNQVKRPSPRRKSKRERLTKIVVYIMILGMLLTAFTYGLSAFV